MPLISFFTRPKHKKWIYARSQSPSFSLSVTNSDILSRRVSSSPLQPLNSCSQIAPSVPPSATEGCHGKKVTNRAFTTSPWQPETNLQSLLETAALGPLFYKAGGHAWRAPIGFSLASPCGGTRLTAFHERVQERRSSRAPAPQRAVPRSPPSASELPRWMFAGHNRFIWVDSVEGRGEKKVLPKHSQPQSRIKRMKRRGRERMSSHLSGLGECWPPAKFDSWKNQPLMEKRVFVFNTRTSNLKPTSWFFLKSALDISGVFHTCALCDTVVPQSVCVGFFVCKKIYILILSLKMKSKS